MAHRWFPILAYHSVSDVGTPSFQRYTLSPDDFREHLQYLAHSGYVTFTVSDLANQLNSGVELPAHAVALTFDDAFEDFYTTALPALIEFEMKATLFIPSAFVGTTSTWLDREEESGRRIVSWSQLREIAAVGIECGAHSHTHPELDRLAPAELEREIRTSKTVLEQRLRTRIEAFAYPFGYHSRAVRRATGAAGFRAACAVGETSASATSDPLALPRLTVVHGTDVARLRRLLDNHAGMPTRTVSELKRVTWKLVRSTSAPRRRAPRTES